MSQIDLRMLLQSEYPGSLAPGTVYLKLDGLAWRAYAVSAFVLYSIMPSLEPRRVWLGSANRPVVSVEFPRNAFISVGARLEESGFKMVEYSPSEKFAVFSLPEGMDAADTFLSDYREWLFRMMLHANRHLSV